MIRQRSIWARLGPLILMLVILVPACIGFSMKFRELVALSVDEDGAFAIMPVVTYLVTSVGFLFLLIFAMLRGMFRNIEKPKYDMLERERQLDEEEEQRAAEATWR